MDNMIKNIENDKLESKKLNVLDIWNIGGYLFIVFDNHQKILTDGTKFYDVSNYDNFEECFKMNDRLCAVMSKYYTIYVIDLETMEVLFEDKNAYYVRKNDDRTLYVDMKIGRGYTTTIYDIETKRYLPVLDSYEFKMSLGNHLYVFEDENDKKHKKCVINADGKTILKDIDGWIKLFDNFIIVQKADEICVTRVNENDELDIKSIKQDKDMIAKPDYYDGMLIIMKKKCIEIYNPDFKLVNKFIIDELEGVLDYEIISSILKIYLPYNIDGKKINKHLFVNLKTGKMLSHLRIGGYPYWMPTTYIAKDNDCDKITDYHFYDANFNKVIDVMASSYESVEVNKECMFFLKTIDNEKVTRQLLNAENGIIKEVDYDYVHFHSSLPYGYGVNSKDEMMDFLDENLHIIIPNFDYKKFNLNVYDYTSFNYFIVNDYICISKVFTVVGGIDCIGQTRFRYIIQHADGEVILDSTNHECYKIGNFIQIIHDDKSEFLNTITGEISPLNITAKVDENGKIDFNKLNGINNILAITSAEQDDIDNSPKKLINTIKR